MSARRSQLEPLADAGSKRAAVGARALRAASALDARDSPSSASPSARCGLGAVAEPALHHLLEPIAPAARACPTALADAVALALALLIVVYLHVVVGEMIPKNLAIAGPDRAALVLVPPLLVVARALRARHPR